MHSVAAGAGRIAVLLAKPGGAVSADKIAVVALEKAAGQARAAHVAVDVVQEDVFSRDPPNEACAAVVGISSSSPARPSVRARWRERSRLSGREVPCFCRTQDYAPRQRAYGGTHGSSAAESIHSGALLSEVSCAWEAALRREHGDLIEEDRAPSGRPAPIDRVAMKPATGR